MAIEAAVSFIALQLLSTSQSALSYSSLCGYPSRHIILPTFRGPYLCNNYDFVYTYMEVYNDSK